MPVPSAEYFGDGIAFESMGALQQFPATQAVVEQKVRDNAALLEKAPYGYRPAIGFQANRLLAPVDGPSYGLPKNAFADSTPSTPASPERFEKQYERRGPGYSKIDAIDRPEDVLAFNSDEAYGPKTNGKHSVITPMVKVSA
jgi:hypothetical protein